MFFGNFEIIIRHKDDAINASSQLVGLSKHLIEILIEIKHQYQRI